MEMLDLTTAERTHITQQFKTLGEILFIYRVHINKI